MVRIARLLGINQKLPFEWQRVRKSRVYLLLESEISNNRPKAKGKSVLTGLGVKFTAEELGSLLNFYQNAFNLRGIKSSLSSAMDTHVKSTSS
jgi:hypothetical protein